MVKSVSQATRMAAILDAAERIFGTHGYAGASMRQIADEAGVAQASLHYHYACKDKLYEAVFERRSTAINVHRGRLLDAIFEHDVMPAIEDVLTIAFTPLSSIFHGDDAKNLARYVQMVAAISSGSDVRSRRLREQFYDPFAQRFIDALYLVAPGITREAAVWACLFSIGARQQAHALNGRASRLGIADRSQAPTRHYEGLVCFAAAGIRESAVQVRAILTDRSNSAMETDHMNATRARKASTKQDSTPDADRAPNTRVSAILNAAERVFGEHGYAGASMRNIADEAGVAQALVHYHYATKDKLFEAVFERRSSRINAHRGKLLDELFSSGRTATVEDVLTIAFTPLSEIFHGEDADNLALYVQLVAAVSLGSDERSIRVREKFYDPIAERVIDALHTVMPGISHEHATWAYLFSVGARQQAHALNGRAARLGASERTSRSTAHYEQLVRFAAAGIRALVGSSVQSPSASPTKPAAAKRARRVA